MGVLLVGMATSFTASAISALGDISNWNYSDGISVHHQNPVAGIFEQTANGIRITTNQYRGEGSLTSKVPYTLSGRTIIVTWSGSGGASYSQVVIGQVTTPFSQDPGQVENDCTNSSFGNSYNNSWVPSADTLYKTAIVMSDSTFISTTIEVDTGQVAETLTGTCDFTSPLYLLFRQGDTYDNQAADLVLHSFTISDAPLPVLVTNTTRLLSPNYAEGLHFVDSSQLKVFNVSLGSGSFGSAGLIDPDKPTIVITHGWLSSSNADWIVKLALSLHNANGDLNILAWDWSDDALSGQPGTALGRAPNEGNGLGLALAQELGSGYTQDLQFIGHSLGTIVNARAAEVYHSLVTLPRIQLTLFDEAEIANLKEVGGGQSGMWNRSISNVGTATRIDNYISSFGNTHPEAENIVLDKPLLDVSYFLQFHGYPQVWYKSRVDDANSSSLVGYKQSLFAAPGQASLANTYWEGGTDGSMVSIDALTAMEKINLRNIGLATSAEVEDFGPIALLGGALIDGNITELDSALEADAIQIVGHVNSSLAEAFDPSTGLIGAVSAVFDLTKHSPSYAWVPIKVPSGATGLTFNFQFRGLSDGDYLSVGLADTMLFALEAKYAGNLKINNSGLLDVSAWSGQTVELFLGLNTVDADNVGGSVEVSSIKFYTPVSEAKSPGGIPIILRKGRTTLTSKKSRFVVEGETSGEVTSVSYRIGKGALSKAVIGTNTWKFKVKLRHGKNLISVVAFGPNGASAPLKLIVFYKPRTR